MRGLVFVSLISSKALSNISLSIPMAIELYIIIKRLYASRAKRLFPVLEARPSTEASVRPRFKIVSIIPGIETGAPDRTETRSGSLGSPRVFFVTFSRFFICFWISASSPSGHFFPFL